MFRKQSSGKKFIFVPLLCGITASSISLALYAALNHKQKSEIRASSNAEAAAVKNQLSIVLNERVEAFERMAARWSFEGANYSKEDWLQDVGAHHAHFSGLEASAWADERAVVKWGFPKLRTQNYTGYQLTSELQSAHAFALAREKKRTAFLPMTELKTGVLSFAAYTPFFFGESFHGVLVNAFNAKEFFAKQLPLGKFGYIVSSGDDESYRSEEVNRLVVPEGKSVTHLSFRELDWTIEVFATESLIRSQKSPLPGISLAVGLLFSFLMSWIVRLNLLGRQAKREAWYDLVWQRAIVSGTDFGIISTDMNGIVQSLNPGGEKITGFSRDEAVGKLTPFAWHDPIEIEARTNIIKTKRQGAVVVGIDVFTDEIQNGGIAKHEWTILAKDGRTKIVNISVHRLEAEDGTPFGYVGIHEDVSEKVAQQRLLDEQKIKLVQASKFAALGEMAASIAHEINNPVAIISGKVFGLRNMVEKSKLDTNRFLEDLGKIDDTARRIAKITKGLQNFSRDPSTDPFVAVSVEELVNTSVALCAERFTSHGIRLSVLTPDEPLSVMSRSFQLSQVLVNLLSNAFDAALVSESRWVRMEVRRDVVGVKFVVNDSGTGVPEVLREKILQPFFTTKPPGKGTGLGLSISAGIVRDHGGDLTFKSGSGHGSFEVWVPVAHAHLKISTVT